MIYINSWYGRLGNNITQIVNAIYFAHYKKIKIIKFPYHSCLLTKEIIIEDIILENNINGSKIFSHIFFSRHKIISFYKISEDIFKNKIDIKKYLSNILIYDNLNEKINNEDLVIHVRSGDVYDQLPHSGWIQPPLNFYEKIIESNKWEKIYLICEDNNPPVIKPLLNKYKNIIFKLRDLQHDIYYIVNAKNICFGMGSFTPALLLLNKNIKTIYYPQYCHRYLIDLLDHKERKVYTLKNYIKKGEWKNTKEQIKIILNYKIE